MLNNEVIDIIKSMTNNRSLLVLVNAWIYGIDGNISNLRLRPRSIYFIKVNQF